jgi:16S rRNA (guanine966-N2)-methyltransferase
MRIIAGKYRSRVLQSLPGLSLRPSSDRLRETLFNVLTAGNPSALQGSVWLDLFAGTGAVGIEALSRGAAFVCFVESSTRAAELIRRNVHALQVDATSFRIVQEDVSRFLRRKSDSPKADFAFFDPPYRDQDAYSQTLQKLGAWMKPGAIAIAEHEKRFDPGEESGTFIRYRKLVQGDAALSFYRLIKLTLNEPSSPSVESLP